MTLILHAEERKEMGKKVAALRKTGRLPAIAYGPKDKPSALSLQASEFKKIWQAAGESSVVTLQLAGDDKDVLIHEVAVHAVTGEPLHVDLYVIEKGKLLKVDVPLVFTGISPAVKTLGGVLVKVMHEIEVEAMPRSLPHELAVDISVLASFEDKITVADLLLPEGVTVSADPEEIVALVSEPKAEEEAPVAATIADIEVVGAKGKKEEDGATAEGEKE